MPSSYSRLIRTLLITIGAGVISLLSIAANNGAAIAAIPELKYLAPYLALGGLVVNGVLANKNLFRNPDGSNARASWTPEDK